MVVLHKNCRLNLDCPVTLSNALITTPFGATYLSRGVHTYGQADVNIINSTWIQYASDGLRAYNYSQSPSAVNIQNSEFAYCTHGIYAYDVPINMTGGGLENSDYGCIIEGSGSMSSTNIFDGVTVDYNNYDGIQYTAGTSSDILKIKSCSINNNSGAGVNITGGNLYSRCTVYEENSENGVSANGTNLHIAPESSTYNTGDNEFINNTGAGIYFIDGLQWFVDGYNNFIYDYNDDNIAIAGYFGDPNNSSCIFSYIAADHNRWENGGTTRGSLVWAEDYEIYYMCNGMANSYTLVDPTPVTGTWPGCR